MLVSSNPISVFIDAIFAIVNVALTVVFGYLGTIATYALVAALVAVALFAVIAGLRTLRRNSRDTS
ncbi:MAG: hypothetical protein R3D51_02415 [Hyphomicrobiaceae bacterium]